MLVVYSVHHNQLFLLNSLQADYLLSDANAKTWAIASKQAEQCIYPNLTRIQQQHFCQRR